VRAPRLVLPLVVGVGLIGASASSARAQERPKGQVQAGPDFGLVVRPARSNEAGVAYGTGISYGAHVQLLTASFLRVSLYSHHDRQSLTMPVGSLGRGLAVHPDDDHVTSYILGARLEPTWNVTSRLHLWASLGAGWGELRAPPMWVGDEGSPARYRIGERDAVMVELPFGVGGSFDIIPRWIGASLDLTYAPLSAQSGDAYDPAQAVDGAGHLVQAAGLPKPTSAFFAFASVFVEL
jgi:hypothetical protein